MLTDGTVILHKLVKNMVIKVLGQIGMTLTYKMVIPANCRGGYFMWVCSAHHLWCVKHTLHLTC